MKAFPIESKNGINYGMDLRDYFAAMAMQAIISRSDFEFDDFSWETAYDAADAMMRAREK